MIKKTTMTKNLNTIRKCDFSTALCLFTDKGKGKYLDKLNELFQEQESIKRDLDSIHDAVRAASKMITGEETPSKQEDESLSQLKENYPSYFDDSDAETEGPSGLLNRIKDIKSYLSSERIANAEAISREKQKDVVIGAKRKVEDDNPESSTSKKVNESFESPLEPSKSEQSPLEPTKSEQSPLDEPSKKKAEDNEGSSTSKEDNESFIDSLGDLYYNPFDDVGFD